MSIFSKIGKGIAGLGKSAFGVATSPIRMGKALIEGDPRKALGILGGNFRFAAPILGATGIGMPVAAAMGGLGAAAQRWGEGESNVGRILSSGAGGAAVGAAGALAGGAARGAPRAIANPELASIMSGGSPVATAATTGVNQGLASIMSNASTGVAPAVATSAVPSVASVASSVPQTVSTAGTNTGVGAGQATMQDIIKESAQEAGGIGSRILSALTSKPAVAAQVLGAGADVYGASRMGAAEDRRIEMQEGLDTRALNMREDEFDRNERQRQMQMMMQFISSMGGRYR